MEHTVEVVGDEAHTVDVPEDATVADLVDPLAVSIHEVSVLVDGSPVPEDSPVPTAPESIRVVRLIKGG